MKVLIDNIFLAKRELARIYKDYKADKITTEKYRTSVYGLSTLINAIYRFEIEARIEELEKRANL